MVDLSQRKIVKIGGSNGIIIPKDIADKCTNGKVWIAILEDHEAPSDEELLRWIMKE